MKKTQILQALFYKAWRHLNKKNKKEEPVENLCRILFHVKQGIQNILYLNLVTNSNLLNLCQIYIYKFL